MSLAVIINPVSGGGRDRGRERAALAASALASIGRTADIFISERRGHAHELARAAIARGTSLIASWGGDGTMNEIASAAAKTATAIALIPSGSGNGLARTLDVSLDPSRAIVEACRAQPRMVDGGRCGDDWFFSVAGVGFDAHVAAGFDVAGRKRRGLKTYIRVAVRSLLTYQARAYTIDGIRLERPALLVTVANAAQFGNGAWIAPSARVDDGELDLVVVEERSRLASIAAVPHLFMRSIGRVRGVSMRRVRQVVIEDEVAISYHLDGEPKPGGRRLELRVEPAVLRVSVR